MNEDKVAGMEMPCMCDCGNWFDLNDGYPSELQKNKVICEECGEKEEEYLELQNEIDDLEIQIGDYESDIDEAKENIEFWEKEKDKAESKLEELQEQLKRFDI